MSKLKVSTRKKAKCDFGCVRDANPQSAIDCRLLMFDVTVMPKNPLENFDYHVDCDDFLLYELGRLIEEDRVTFEDEEFRRLIRAGIHEHIERRLEIRANIAMRLRTSHTRPDRMLHAIEDIESPVRDLPHVIHSYTAYLFQRLEQCSEITPDEKITTAADLDRKSTRLNSSHLGI